MKPQVMTISTSILHEEQHNGEIPTKSAKLDISHMKQEPDDISETESTSPRDAPGPRHSHHRKKMVSQLHCSICRIYAAFALFVFRFNH